MPSVVATSQASQGATGASFSCNKPTGTADGHLLLAWHSTDVGSLASMSISAGGAAWNTLTSLVANDGSSNPTKLYWKIAASEPASYTFNHASNADAVATIIAISGADTSAPLWSSLTGGAGTTISTDTVNAPGTSDLDIRFVAVSGSLGTSESFTPPAGYTEFADIGSRQYVYVTAAYKQLSSSGATGVQNFTITTAATNRERVSVVVTVPAATPKSLADSGTGSDALTVDTAETLVDSASAADVLTIAASADLTDSATASESLTVSVAVDLADSAAGDDSLASGSPIDFADSAVADDTLAAVPTPVYDELATADDTISVAATVSLADAATAADAITVSEVTPKDLADSATAADALSVVVLEDLDFVAGPLRRGWSSRTTSQAWATDMPTRGWAARTPTV